MNICPICKKRHNPPCRVSLSEPAYNLGIKDAIVWLLKNHGEYKPEFLAECMANDLLPKHKGD